MALVRIERTQWFAFCNGMTRMVLGKRAEIEIASQSLGAQIEARWLPLLGVAYDRKRDTLEIALDGIDHRIERPRELYVDYGSSGVEQVGILDADGAWQIVLLRDPLMLPPPERHSG